VLYLNYAALENGKTHHVLLIISTNNIPTMSHYSWTKESRTLDKKLNGKKSNEIRKFYCERDIFKLSKAKKKKKKKKKKIFKGGFFFCFNLKKKKLNLKKIKIKMGFFLVFFFFVGF